MKIILASASPRRRELLENIGLKFDIKADNSEEEIIENEHPSKTVLRLSKQKALNIAKGEKDEALVIGADTVVSIDGVTLGKPKSESEAKIMLKMLSGRKHTVYTGISVINTLSRKTVSEYIASDVYFRKLDSDEIDRYIATKEPMDKAGAYGIQGIGTLFIEKIDGDYFNVVGLPICTLGTILKRDFGVDII